MIRDLPLNGRDMAQLILLQPGVKNSRAACSSSNTGRGTRFSVAGLSSSQIFPSLMDEIMDALTKYSWKRARVARWCRGPSKNLEVLTNTYTTSMSGSRRSLFSRLLSPGQTIFMARFLSFCGMTTLTHETSSIVAQTPTARPTAGRSFGGISMGSP